MTDEGYSPLPQASPLPAPPKKEGMSIGCIVALVLGVVGFVVLFLVPARPAILGIGERPLRARSEMQNIVLAVKAYQTEYSRIPALESPPPTKDNTEGYDTSNEQGRGLIEILTGTDDSKNPRQITFYKPPAHKKTVVATPKRMDSWISGAPKGTSSSWTTTVMARLRIPNIPVPPSTHPQASTLPDQIRTTTPGKTM
jgi:hypothetical protein